MLESSNNEKLWDYSNYKSPNFKDCSEVRSADPPILFYYLILRIRVSDIFCMHALKTLIY